MDGRIKILVGALIGGVAGYIVGDFIVSKWMTEDEYEVIEVKEEVVEEVVEEEKPKDPDRPKMRVKNRPPILTRDYTKNFTKKEKGDLKTLASKYKKPEAKEVEERLNNAIEEGERIRDSGVDLDEPHVISEQEFNERPEVQNGYSKSVLHYYDVDDVLTDEGDEPLLRPEKMIGTEALTAFGQYEDADPDIVYVYNPKTMDLYEIIRRHQSYSVDVTGEGGIPAKSSKRGTPRKGRKVDEES